MQNNIPCIRPCSSIKLDPQRLDCMRPMVSGYVPVVVGFLTILSSSCLALFSRPPTFALLLLSPCGHMPMMRLLWHACIFVSGKREYYPVCGHRCIFAQAWQAANASVDGICGRADMQCCVSLRTCKNACFCCLSLPRAGVCGFEWCGNWEACRMRRCEAMQRSLQQSTWPRRNGAQWDTSCCTPRLSVGCGTNSTPLVCIVPHPEGSRWPRPIEMLGFFMSRASVWRMLAANCPFSLVFTMACASTLFFGIRHVVVAGFVWEGRRCCPALTGTHRTLFHCIFAKKKDP